MILSNEICLILILIQNKLFLGGKEAEEAVIKNVLVGAWVAQLVGRLPSAQVMVLESRDRVPHRAPCSAGSLLLPLTLTSLILSLK